MRKANLEIRQRMKEARISQWQVADIYGVHEQTFCRKLRKELPAVEKDRILRIIKELKQDVS